MKTSKIHRHPVTICGITYSLFVIFFTGMFFSCTTEENFPGDGPSLLITMGDAPSSFVTNSHVFMFDNNTDRYLHQPANLRRDLTNSELYMDVLAGIWNFVILACDRDILPNLTYPVNSVDRTDAIMYTMQESTAGILLDMPEEFRLAYLPNVSVTAHQNYNLTADLERNVGKIEVELKSAVGTDVIQNGTDPNAFVRISNVPNTLTWDGGLYPNKSNPQVSAKPMDKLFVFNAAGVADTVSFIVPAYRGINANDTSTRKLDLEVCLPVNGNQQWGIGKVQIPYVPRPNKIIHINLTFSAGAELEVQVSVKDWEAEKDQDITFGS